MLKLNVGCGLDIKEGFVNIDIAKLDGVDIVCNIDKEKLPFEDNSVEYIYCRDILEHVNYIEVLREFNRVMVKGAKLYIRVPHFTSANNFVDPTHINMFSFRTFQFFTTQSIHDRSYYFDYAFDHLEYSKIVIPHIPFFGKIINSNANFQKLYEGTFLRSLFPASNLECLLVK